MTFKQTLISHGSKLIKPTVLITILPLICLLVAIHLYSYRVFFLSNIYGLAASIQDDSFYYLIPAFNFAHGKGFSFGGLTSYGFEPGYEIILTSIATCFSSTADFLRSVLFFNVVLFALTGVLVAKVAGKFIDIWSTDEARFVNRRIAYTSAAFLYLSNNWNYFNSITAKENPLAALLLATVMLVSLRPKDKQTPGSVFLAGSLAGGLLLTRPIPATLLYIGLLLHAYWPNAKRFLVAASLPIMAWVFFAWVYFGTPFPYSALVKSAAPSNAFTYSFFKQSFAYVMASASFGATGPSSVNIPQPNWNFALRSNLSNIALLTWLTMSIILLLIEAARQRLSKKRLLLLPMFLVAMSIGALLTSVALQLKRPAEQYYASWYFYDSPVVLCIVMGVAAGMVLDLLPKLRANQWLAPLLIDSALGILMLTSAEHYTHLRPYTQSGFERGVGKRWQNTMIESGLWYKTHVKQWKKLTVVAGSAGALNFILDDHVINLDGLSNDLMARYILDGRRPASFLLLKRPEYFIDVNDFISQVIRNDPSIHLKKIYSFSFPAEHGYIIGRLLYMAPANLNPIFLKKFFRRLLTRKCGQKKHLVRYNFSVCSSPNDNTEDPPGAL